MFSHPTTSVAIVAGRRIPKRPQATWEEIKLSLLYETSAVQGTKRNLFVTVQAMQNGYLGRNRVQLIYLFHCYNKMLIKY